MIDFWGPIAVLCGVGAIFLVMVRQNHRDLSEVVKKSVAERPQNEPSDLAKDFLLLKESYTSLERRQTELELDVTRHLKKISQRVYRAEKLEDDYEDEPEATQEQINEALQAISTGNAGQNGLEPSNQVETEHDALDAVRAHIRRR